MVRWAYFAVAALIGVLPVASAFATYYPDTLRSIESTLFAPGGLSTGHDRLSCAACHSPASSVADQLCGKCHERSASYGQLDGAQLQAHRLAGGHLASGKGPGCLTCHPQHAKQSAGWPAKGHFGDLFELELCVTCHEVDREVAHPSILSSDCQDCHSTNNWQSGFRHPVVSVPGGAVSSCADCHQADWHTRRWSGPEVRGGSVDCGLCHEMRR